jgi:hypothetical protein
VPGRGVPPKRVSSPERVSIATRISRSVYEDVMASAKTSGRSLSEEIEYRLLQSFQKEGFIEVIRDEVMKLVRN